MGSAFGGGYDAPDPVVQDPIPVREAETEPVSKSVRQAEQRKIRQRRGAAATLLTSPLGGGSNNLLGRSL